jgi:hypothetical protein
MTLVQYLALSKSDLIAEECTRHTFIGYYFNRDHCWGQLTALVYVSCVKQVTGTKPVRDNIEQIFLYNLVDFRQHDFYTDCYLTQYDRQISEATETL